MNLTTNTQQLSHELTAHNAIVDKKHTIPALGCVSLKAEDGTLILESNNLERGMQSRVAGSDILEDGHTLVPGAELTKIVKALPGEQARLKSDDHTLSITSGTASFTLSTLDPEDFPEVSTFGFQPLCELSGKELHALLDPTLFAVSSDESRYALTGVLWDIAEQHSDDETLWQIRCVSTDGHRLQAAKVVNIAMSDAGQYIIPGKAGADLLRIFGDDERIEILVAENQFRARAGHRSFVSRLIDAQFPDYRHVIPNADAATHTMRLDRDAWIAALRRVALLTSDTRLVKFSVAPGTLTMSANDPNMGEAEEAVPCEYDGDGIVCGYNAHYVMHALQSMDAEQVEWQTRDALSPAKLSGIGLAGQVSVVMPMRV